LKRTRLLTGLGIAFGLVVVSTAALWRVKAAKKAEAGKALFSGSVALSARMVGHDTDLPPETVRCSNCHTRQRPAPLASATAPTAATAGARALSPRDVYGSALSAKALFESRPRRGGPPSRYDLAAFCRVLAQGIDPAHVMIAQTMPRYRLSAEQRENLWSFVTSE
jgi:hypothetical protein